MRTDVIQQYIQARNFLREEKTRLEERLSEINEALGAVGETIAESRQQPTASAPSSPSKPAFGSSPAKRGPKGRRGRRGSNPISLREAVIQVTNKRPLTKQEILDEVQKLGYRFTGSNPANTLGVIIYGKNPKFRNVDGRFSLSGGSSAGASRIAVSSGVGKRAGGRRRTMSPEARERIAAAQRARWARQRRG